MKIKLIAVLAAVVVLMGACNKGTSQGGAAQPYTIEVGGSTSVTPLMELFAHEYEKVKPNIKVNINGDRKSVV